MTLADLPSPALLLDRGKLDRNIARMDAAMRRQGVALRPHMKTAKSLPVARLMTAGWSGAITVSTLAEARAFAAAGYRDILYAVGLAPAKLPEVAALIAGGADVSIILDSVAAGQAVAAFGRAEGMLLPVLVEIDSDGHRAGVQPDDAALLLAIADILGAGLRGVMTHGGGSYERRSAAGLRAHAALERAGVVDAAAILRVAGHAAPVVSVGSTPTALFADSFAGVTEVRAGVYCFMDLVMAGLGVCAPEDIAISVLARVIGHQPQRGQAIVDAGWTALSRDRGTAAQPVDQGYGMVCDADGALLPDLLVVGATQEHGIVARRAGGLLTPADLPLGSAVRILPNHACATAGQHEQYQVVDGDAVVDRWPSFRGW